MDIWGRDGGAQRFALPALGRGRRSLPARKMIRRVKLLGMCAESPASGARFVRRVFFYGFLLLYVASLSREMQIYFHSLLWALH